MKENRRAKKKVEMKREWERGWISLSDFFGKSITVLIR